MAGKEFIVPVQERKEFGTSAARRLRRQGLTPLVVYSHGADPLPLALTQPEAERLGQHHGMVGLRLDSANDPVNAIVRDVQVNPLTQRILHIDCLGVRADEEINVSVPLEPVGEPPGVSEGGILDQQRFEIEVSCLPGNVPEAITVDVSGLATNDSLTVADLPPQEGLVFLDDPEETLFVVSEPTEEPSEEELEEAAEMTEAEPELVGGESETEAETEE